MTICQCNRTVYRKKFIELFIILMLLINTKWGKKYGKMYLEKKKFECINEITY